MSDHNDNDDNVSLDDVLNVDDDDDNEDDDNVDVHDYDPCHNTSGYTRT